MPLPVKSTFAAPIAIGRVLASAKITSWKILSVFSLIYQNKVRVDNNYEIYRRRQTIVENPYGVIKRQWGFYYIMTKKTIKHDSPYVGLIFTAYNLRRIFNLIDPNLLKQYIRSTALLFYCY
jgi:hypothetical protein